LRPTYTLTYAHPNIIIKKAVKKDAMAAIYIPMAVPITPKKATKPVIYAPMIVKNPAIGKKNKQPVISSHSP